MLTSSVVVPILNAARTLPACLRALDRLRPAPDEVIMVSDLLDTLGSEHPLEAQIVKLHDFAGLSISEAGRAIGLSSSTAHRYWTFGRAWLHEALQSEGAKPHANPRFE